MKRGTDGSDIREFRERVSGLTVEEVLQIHPDSGPVLFNHFGASCFDCPARTRETIDFAVRIHESPEDEFYRDLFEAISDGTGFQTTAYHEKLNGKD